MRMQNPANDRSGRARMRRTRSFAWNSRPRHVNQEGMACVRMLSRSDASMTSSFWWCQALNHTLLTPTRFISVCSMRMTELFPRPQGALIAMVSGGRWWRRCADSWTSRAREVQPQAVLLDTADRLVGLPFVDDRENYVLDLLLAPTPGEVSDGGSENQERGEVEPRRRTPGINGWSPGSPAVQRRQRSSALADGDDPARIGRCGYPVQTGFGRGLLRWTPVAAAILRRKDRSVETTAQARFPPVASAIALSASVPVCRVCPTSRPRQWSR